MENEHLEKMNDLKEQQKQEMKQVRLIFVRKDDFDDLHIWNCVFLFFERRVW